MPARYRSVPRLTGAAGEEQVPECPIGRTLLFRAPTNPVLTDGPGSVAVIMRTKDRPILLRRALASVTNQSFARWHLFIVNDGGNRAEVNGIVADHAGPLGGRVTVLHNDHSQGMEAASNQALACADAAYFVIHDDDDSWEPAFLQITTAFLDAPANAALVGVVTGCTSVDERICDGAIVIERRQAHNDTPKLNDLAALLMINRALPISLLYRMSLFRKLGGFNPDLPVIGDWEFNIRALLTGEIGYIPTALANYHTRVARPTGAYANSSTGGSDQHREYDRLLRNAVVRKTIEAHPELLGLLQPMLHAIDAARRDLMVHINQVGSVILEQQRKNTATLLDRLLDNQAQQEEAIVARILAGMGADLRT